MAESNANNFLHSGAYSNRTSNEFDHRDIGPADAPVGNKFDLGPRWSSEEIHLFFDGKSAFTVSSKYNSMIFYSIQEKWQGMENYHG